jgi:hypothetical protein
MTWTPERKLEAAVQAPLARLYVREDTRIIERPGWYQVVTPSAKTYMNEVVLSQLEDDDVERVIDETIAMYRPHGVRFRWNVGPVTRPANLGARLERRGFQRIALRAMGIDTATPLTMTERDARGVIGEEVDSAGLDGFVRTMLRGWGMPEDQADDEVRLHQGVMNRIPRAVHFFGAKVDGEWAATSALLLRDGYGYFLGGQVLEPARGRGAYRALLVARLAFLRERGFEYAVTHAHEATSAPVLEHLGFETLFTSASWTLTPWPCESHDTSSRRSP